MRQLKFFLIVAVATLLLNACSPAGGDFAGSEYMPDMAHSVAYEANSYIYYHYNTWDSASVFKLKELSNPHLPVHGTIPRGYTGIYYAGDALAQQAVMDHLHGMTTVNEISTPVNGNVPFYYANTEEDRTRAMNEIIANPFPITEAGLESGNKLYTIYCGICHGDKGDGLGYLVSDVNKNAKYPAQPANLLDSAFVNSTNGRYYYTIMHGRNAMGSYADKLSYEERWDVIHYIRFLQAKDKQLVYSDKANTLNPLFGTPASQMRVIAQQAPDNAPPPGEATDHTGQENSGQGHGNGENHQ